MGFESRPHPLSLTVDQAAETMLRVADRWATVWARQGSSLHDLAVAEVALYRAVTQWRELSGQSAPPLGRS